MKKKHGIYLLLSAIETKGLIMATIFLAVMVTTGVAHAYLSGSSVKVDAPHPLPVATFDLVFKMTLAPNDGEFADRLDLTLPDGWILNSLVAPPPSTSTSCIGVGTQASATGQTAIWEISGGYTGGSTCGPWNAGLDGADFSFIVNVTVPDCSGAPWIIPWKIYGDRWLPSAEPHDISGTLNINTCVVPAISSGNSYTFTTIDHPDALVGGDGTQISGINDSGLIVGHYKAAESTRRGFLYDGTTFFPIDYPGAEDTAAYAINNSGHVVGVYGSGGGTTSGFTYNGSTYTPINRPASLGTWVFDINDSDHITGTYATATGYYGFHDDGSSINEINYPGNSITFFYTFLFGVNNGDEIVGISLDSTGVPHGFRYNGTNFTNIFYPKAIGMQVTDISDSGTVVGSYYDSGNKEHGFIFDGISRYTQLDYPGSEETAINAINERGDLAGFYLDNSGTEHGYIARKFSWPLFYPAIIREK
jgi:hypothetical protein